MLQLFRRKGQVAEQPLDALVNSNKPPTEDQRHKLDSAIRALKFEYQRACGKPYIATDPIPQPGQRYHEDIQRHQRALLPFRKFHAEILQTIFKYAVLSIEPKTSQTSMVGVIRLVSQIWNDAAINCPFLWCNLPLMDLTIIPVSTNEGSISRVSEWALHHHLDRSGSMPISFTFHFWPGDEIRNKSREQRMREEEAKKWVGILAQESHRWDEVEFQVTGSVARPLWDRLRVPGRVPLLSKFVYQRKGFDGRDRKTNRALEHLDLSAAPRLRHLMYDSLGLNQAARNLSIEGAKTHLLLPWVQLETFECATQKDTMYPKLLEQSENLQVLKYTSNRSNTLPTEPVFLHHLTKLSLCFGEELRGECLAEHLKYFTLPSLKELEVYWGNRFDRVDIYGSISSLIQRSSCTLERLATEHKNLGYDYEGQVERFQEVLYRCPHLTHLDIAYLDAAKLDLLIPHQNQARKPPLPNLRVLTLRSHRAQGSMDPIPLLRVVFGRTDLSRKPPNSHLEDVYVKHDDGDLWRNVVLEVGEHDSARSLQTPFDPEFYSIAISWKMELLPTPSVSDANVARRDRGNVLRDMRSFDLQGRDTRVLIWLGIPALLDSLSGREKPGLLRKRNPVKDRCRQLAEETLKHWKPFLLSDFQASSYRYCFSGKTTSRLKFIDKGMDSSGDVPTTFDSELQKMATLQVDSRPDRFDVASEEGDWRRILGRGDIDVWATAPKGPTWLPDRDWECESSVPEDEL